MLHFILLLFLWIQTLCASDGLAFRASRVIVNEKAQTVLAEGNVLIKYQGRFLQADRVMYFRKTNRVVAEGHVQMDEAAGHTFFADRADVNDQLKDGYIQQIKVLLSDHSKLSALDGQYRQNIDAQVNRVRYSPCKVCRKDKNAKPLWQLCARNAHWDFQKKDIQYKDAVLEFFGVPVFYTPFFSHPDPTVERRSGFLSPSLYGGRSGHMIETPYYHVLGRHKDLTLAPVVGSQNQIMKAKYRHRFHKGLLNFQGSVGQTKRVKSSDTGGQRYHIDSELKMDINERWRTSLAAKRTSNKSYLRRFKALGAHDKAFLTSRAAIEGFYNNTYLHFQGYSFQGLRVEDKLDPTPFAIPQADINYRSNPTWMKSYWTVDGNLLNLQRKQGESVARGITRAGWHLPFQTALGDSYLLSIEGRADGYNYRPDKSLLRYNTAEDMRSRQLGRVIPSTTLQWRYPFLSHGLRYPVIVEPCASVVIKPTRKLNKNFPNEDSRIREIDDSNHLLTDRFPGLDRVDEGSRLNYGIKASMLGLGAKPSVVYFGQSYNLRTLDPKELPLGVHKRMSDYVSRVSISPSAMLDIHYRTRLQYKTFMPKRHEVISTLGPESLKLQTTFAMVRPGATQTDERSSKQMGFALSSQYIRFWTFTFGGTREFGAGGRFLTRYIQATYVDECFRTDLMIAKNQYYNDAIGRGITYMAKVHFLTLGDFNQRNPRSPHSTDM